MKRLRSLLVGATLSLTLLGGAAGAATAQRHVDGPFPFGQECVSEIAQMGDPAGVGPHIREHHGDVNVGRHLQMMRMGEHDDMDMGTSMCDMGS